MKNSEERIRKFREVIHGADENKKLCEILNVCSAWYARDSIDQLDLSTRAYNCLSRFMDPPLLAPTGCHWTIDELLEVKLGDLKKARNLGLNCCAEILAELDTFLAARQ